MDPTVAFFLYLSLAIAITGLAIRALRTPKSARRLARVFLWLCAVLAFAGLLGVAAVSLPGSVIAGPARAMLRGLSYAGWLVVGTAVAAAGLALFGKRAATRGFAASQSVLAGLAIYVALAFFGFEIGKAAHDGEMREFFTNSGYPIWFMYAVMLAEIAGSLALPVPRTRFIAACGLGLMMVGAIGTHARNGDPFSDSLDALRMLILVVCIAALELKRRSMRAV